MQTIQAPYPSDEIDVRDLAKAIWRAKVKVVVITLAIASLAALYAFLTPPVYRAEVQTLPPSPSGLAAYNLAHQLSGPAIDAVTGSRARNKLPEEAVPHLGPEGAYSTFLRYVSSTSLKQQFFNEVYLPAKEHSTSTNQAEKEHLWKRFNGELTITLPRKPEDNNALKVSIEGSNPQLISDWANQYIEMGMTLAKQQLLGDLQGAMALRINSAEQQINVLRKTGMVERQNDILRLQEAVRLAESIGLEDPPSAGILITSYTGDTTYLRGARALRSELSLLQKRTSDDPYIDGLPDILRKQSLLRSVNLNPENFAVAMVDQAATPPEAPVRPRRILILALGLLFGSAVAVLSVIILYLARRT